MDENNYPSDEFQVTNEERTWGMLSHLGVFAGFLIPFGNIIIPLVIYLIKKDSSPFISENAKESLNFQIALTIYAIISAILIFVIIGIFLVIAIAIFEIVVIIIAGIRANKGEIYKYPFSIRFIK